MAESFRTALTSFLRTNLEGVRPRVVMITSSSPNSGKTLSVTNLGIAFAEINQKVLLIDGDLRRPRLHEIFSISNTNGFSDLLAEEGPIDSARLNSSIRRSFISGLHVLPSGSRTSDIAQLFYKPRMADLFTRFRADFDWVLIDAPPVLTLFDARVLGLMTDGVILVCRAGHTSQEQLVAAWKDLADDGIPVLGTILNDWNPQGSDPAYYGAYSQYYRGTQSRDPEQGS